MYENVYTHDQDSQHCFERVSPPSPFASPPGGAGSNAEPAWTDPSPVSWSSCSDWLLHRFSRLALRSHQGMAWTYGPEDEGGPHCCPDTQVLHLENDHDDVDVVTVVGQDRHDWLVDTLLLWIWLGIRLCWGFHLVWSLHLGGFAC